MVSIKTVQ